MDVAPRVSWPEHEEGRRHGRFDMLIMGLEPPAPQQLRAPRFSSTSTLGRIQRRGHLRVGIPIDLPGFGVLDASTGRVVGMEADLAIVLAQQLFGGSERTAVDHVQFVPLHMDQRIPYLQERHVDLVLANFADTPQRRKQVDFAGHYLSSSHTAVVPTSSAVARIEDLREVSIAVVDGTTDVETLPLIAPHAEVLALPNAATCIAAVRDGTAQAFWGTQVACTPLVRATNGELRETAIRAGNERWGIGITKGEDDLSRFIDDRVNAALEAGTMNAALDRCFRPN